MSNLPTTATAPSIQSDQRDSSPGSVWIAEFHRHDLLKAYDQDNGKGISAEVLTSRLTDERHLLLDKAHADFWGTGHGKTPEAEYADRILSTAIFNLGAAVQASADPAKTLRALHAALGMTGLGG
jgi:hypothetical protein